MCTTDGEGSRAICAARELGYQGVDLRVSEHKGEWSPDATAAQMDEMRRVFDAEGVEASGLLCYNEIGSSGPRSDAALVYPFYEQRLADANMRHAIV